jgi:hypothetical protein
MKKLLWVGILCLVLSSCMQFCDESCYITDDVGVVHRTIHYTQDKRGRDYFPVKAAATGQKQFIFDPKAFAWAAYDAEGNRLMTGGASGGKDRCDENQNQSCRTATGIFRVYNRRGADCRSGEYPVETTGGAKMPYCTYFFQGYTVHAAYEVPYANTSHGCVRVLPSAAKWLYDNFLTVGTQVTILPYPDEEKIS